ncbi:MAG: ATP-binding protein [Clostridiales Family XIII bacterium]|jgi:hypothetical protein|nr:ATP-binding protein [Clostridiales Family XIII bacterium]
MIVSSSDYNRLLAGSPPEDDELLRRLSVGIDFVTDFWNEQYLDAYIARGGSKIKFLTGYPGSGKSHALRLFLSDARARGYKTAAMSAKQIWIHDFKEIYSAVFKAIDFRACLKTCADKIITGLGYDPADVPRDVTFADFLMARGAFDPITRREFRALLNEMFFRNPRIDKNFAIGSALFAGGILGYPQLEPAASDLLWGWFEGDKGVKIAALRKLGLSPSKITKHNARHMLRSLTEIIRLAGYEGLVIGIDDLEILAATSSLEEIRYTKMRREDAYESIRELIDEIDTLRYTMFVFSFDRDLLEDEGRGLKSYQALWMRIQNEIEGGRVNRFSDIIDLDRVARQEYSAQTLARMSLRLAEAVSEMAPAAKGATETEVAALLESGSLGNELHALPKQIGRMTFASSEIGGNGHE